MSVNADQSFHDTESASQICSCSTHAAMVELTALLVAILRAIVDYMSPTTKSAAKKRCLAAFAVQIAQLLDGNEGFDDGGVRRASFPVAHFCGLAA